MKKGEREKERDRKRIASSPLRLETDPTLTTDCALSTKQETRKKQKVKSVANNERERKTEGEKISRGVKLLPILEEEDSSCPRKLTHRNIHTLNENARQEAVKMVTNDFCVQLRTRLTFKEARMMGRRVCFGEGWM